MKKPTLFVAIVALAAPAVVFAAKPKPGKPGKAARAEAAKAKAESAKTATTKVAEFAKYDVNKNGSLDAEEYEAVRKDFAAEPKGPLAKLDTNGDARLSDDELAAFKPASVAKSKADRKAGRAAKKAAANK